MKNRYRKNQADFDWYSLHKLALKRPEIKNYFIDLLLPIEEQIDGIRTLEIGAGSGISKNILPDHNFLSTDIILDKNQLDFVSDVYSLPFINDSFDLIFAIDVFHHLRRPEEAFSEIYRVLSPQGRLILIEPHISLFSYFIYKIFHHEKTSWRISPEDLFRNISDDPLDADNSVLSSLLFSSKWQSVRRRLASDYSIENIKFRDIFSFFLTGGLQRNKSFLRGRSYKLLLALEKKIPQIVLKFLGSRITITFRKLG